MMSKWRHRGDVKHLGDGIGKDVSCLADLIVLIGWVHPVGQQDSDNLVVGVAANLHSRSVHHLKRTHTRSHRRTIVPVYPVCMYVRGENSTPHDWFQPPSFTVGSLVFHPSARLLSE